MTEPTSSLTKLKVFATAHASFQIVFWIGNGVLASTLGVAAFLVWLTLFLVYAPMRWNFPNSIVKLGENYWFRWAVYAGAFAVQNKCLAFMLLWRPILWAIAKNLIKLPGPDARPDELDHWYIRGNASIFQPHVMNRTDYNESSPTYGLWIPPEEWRDRCKQTGGAPLFACSYFLYEAYPSFMAFIYVAVYLSILISFVMTVAHVSYKSLEFYMKIYNAGDKKLSTFWNYRKWETLAPINLLALNQYESIWLYVWILVSSGNELYHIFGDGLGLIHSFSSGHIYFGSNWNRVPVPQPHELGFTITDAQQLIFGSCWYLRVHGPAWWPWLWGLKDLHWVSMMATFIGPFPMMSTYVISFSICTHWEWALTVAGGKSLFEYHGGGSMKEAVKTAAKTGVIRQVAPPSNVFSRKAWFDNPFNLHVFPGGGWVFQVFFAIWGSGFPLYWAVFRLPQIAAADRSKSTAEIIDEWLPLPFAAASCISYLFIFWFTLLFVAFIIPLVKLRKNSKGSTSEVVKQRNVKLTKLVRIVLFLLAIKIFLFPPGILQPGGVAFLWCGHIPFWMPLRNVLPAADAANMLFVPICLLILYVFPLPFGHWGSNAIVHDGFAPLFGFKSEAKVTIALSVTVLTALALSVIAAAMAKAA